MIDGRVFVRSGDNKLFIMFAFDIGIINLICRLLIFVDKALYQRYISIG